MALVHHTVAFQVFSDFEIIPIEAVRDGDGGGVRELSPLLVEGIADQLG
jgi:hypothetical protein